MVTNEVGIIMIFLSYVIIEQLALPSSPFLTPKSNKSIIALALFEHVN